MYIEGKNPGLPLPLFFLVIVLVVLFVVLIPVLFLFFVLLGGGFLLPLSLVTYLVVCPDEIDGKFLLAGVTLGVLISAFSFMLCEIEDLKKRLKHRLTSKITSPITPTTYVLCRNDMQHSLFIFK